MSISFTDANNSSPELLINPTDEYTTTVRHGKCSSMTMTMTMTDFDQHHFPSPKMSSSCRPSSLRGYRSRSLIISSPTNEKSLTLPLKNRHNLQHHPMDWVSLTVIYFLTLIAEGTRGLFMPTILPYFQKHGGSPNELGTFIAALSLGRIISVVPLGLLSEHLPYSLIFRASSLLQIIGHSLYIGAPSLPMLYASRILVGIGSSTTVISRSHLTKTIPKHLRTQHFAYLSAVQFAGVAVLPIFGGLFSFFPRLSVQSYFLLNETTYPAVFLIIANLFSIFLVSKYYDEPPSDTDVPLAIANRNTSSYGATDLTSYRGSHSKNTNVTALLICFLVNLTLKAVSAGLETIIVPFLSERFQLTVSSASVYVSMLGVCGVVTFCTLRYLALHFSDRRLVFQGLAIVCTACVLLSIPVATIHMGVAVYVACIGAIWSLGLPIAQTANLALFSKLLTDLPVGGFIGLFSASGSLAPLFSAVCTTKIWTLFGEEAVFASLLITVGSSIIIVWFYYYRLTIVDTLPWS